MKKSIPLLLSLVCLNLVSWSQPIASFTVPGPNGYCKGSNITFTNTSTGSTAYQWNFGEGMFDTSTLVNPTKTFNNSGNFIITLKAIQGNDTSVLRKAIYIIQAPNQVTIGALSSWGISNTAPVNETVSLTYNGNHISNFRWRVKNKLYPLNENVKLVFDTAGTLPISFTAFNACGDSAITNGAITFYPETNKATSDFIVWPKVVCPGKPFYLESYHTSDSSGWLFDDGVFIQNRKSMRYVFISKGIHVIKLINTQNGRTDTTTQTIEVSETSIDKSLISANVSPKIYDTHQKKERYMTCLGSAFNLNASLNSYPFKSWRWIFPGGKTIEALDTSVVFQNIGDYDISFQYENLCGFKDSISFTVSVRSSDSVQYYSNQGKGTPYIFVNRKSTDTICPGSTAHFESFGYSNLTWYFDDGTSLTGDAVEKNFLTTGLHTVKVLSRGNCGALSDTGIAEIMVLPNAHPSSGFTINSFNAGINSICIGTQVKLSPEDTLQSGTKHQWDLGDGTSDSTQFPDHVYSSPGYYSIIHEVTNNCDLKSFSVQTFQAISSIQKAEVSTSRYLIEKFMCVFDTLTVRFDASNCDSIILDLGNGTIQTKVISTAPYFYYTPFTYNYPAPGIYHIVLYGYNKCGSVDSVSHDIQIVSLPIADIHSHDTTIPVGVPLQLSSSISGKVRSYWQIDHQTIDTSAAFSHVFTETGSYKVYLVAMNNNGCVSLDSINVNVILNNSITEQMDNNVYATIYPNPASSVLYLDITGKTNTNCKIEVIDLTGKVQLVYAKEIEIGKSNIPINIEFLPIGMYWMRIQTDEGLRTIKFLKQNMQN